jgi:hypothetical protein
MSRLLMLLHTASTTQARMIVAIRMTKVCEEVSRVYQQNNKIAEVVAIKARIKMPSEAPVSFLSFCHEVFSLSSSMLSRPPPANSVDLE